MNGVTTAILLFIFAALAFPKLVKHRSQFYMALIAVLLVILLDAVAHAVHSDAVSAFGAFTYCMAGILQIFAVVLIVLSVGGLSAGELAGEMSNAIELLRRGETEKEVIIPLSAAAMKKKPEDQATARRPRRDGEEGRPREKIELHDPPAPAPAPSALPRKPDTGPLPLE